MSGSTIKTAVILLSGGLDSATTLMVAQNEGYQCHALAVDYGQRHESELEAARRIAGRTGADLKIVTVDLRAIGGSALTDDMEVPTSPGGGIPVTYVPARNTILLSLALGHAEVLQAADIFIGVNAVDYSGYPDCRPEFIAAYQNMAGLATKAGVEGKSHFKIHTPLIQMTKSQIIRKGYELGVDFALAWSCYDGSPEGKVCRRCDACLLREKGFREAGLLDPLR